MTEGNRQGAIIAETDRLRIRQFTLEDAAFILVLVNEPTWLRFIGDRDVHDLEGARNYITKGPLQMYAQQGYGLFLVEIRDSRLPIGMCGLLKRDYLPEPDIGFAFLPQHVGKGYAFEAAKAVLDYGRKQYQLTSVAAIVNPDNVASMRLLGKLGFEAAGQIRHPGEDQDIKLFRTRS